MHVVVYIRTLPFKCLGQDMNSRYESFRKKDPPSTSLSSYKVATRIRTCHLFLGFKIPQKSQTSKAIPFWLISLLVDFISTTNLRYVLVWFGFTSELGSVKTTIIVWIFPSLDSPILNGSTHPFSHNLNHVYFISSTIRNYQYEWLTFTQSHSLDQFSPPWLDPGKIPLTCTFQKRKDVLWKMFFS